MGGIKSSPFIPSTLIVVVDLIGVFTFFSFFLDTFDFSEFLLRRLLSSSFRPALPCSYFLSSSDFSVLYFERPCLVKLLLFLLEGLLYLNYTADFCFFFSSSISLYCLITSLFYLRIFLGLDFFSALFGVLLFFFSALLGVLLFFFSDLLGVLLFFFFSLLFF